MPEFGPFTFGREAGRATRREQRREEFTTEIEGLAGAVVRRAYQESGEFHSLDEGYAADGDIVVEFEDGRRLVVSSHWCNDSTSSTEYEIERPGDERGDA